MATIPKPKHCDQNWLDMKPNARGRLCGKCGHTLLDFTEKSWLEIELIQQENNNTVCGLYSDKQLKFWGREIPKEKPASKFLVAASMVLAPVFGFKNEANAQVQNAAQQPVQNETETAESVNDKVILSSDSLVLRGRLLDSTTLQPIPYGNIVLKKSEEQAGYALTDINGYFLLKAKVNKDASNEFSFYIPNVGYLITSIKLNTFPDLENIILYLKPDPDIVYSTNFSVIQPTKWQTFKWKIRDLFRKSED